MDPDSPESFGEGHRRRYICKTVAIDIMAFHIVGSTVGIATVVEHVDVSIHVGIAAWLKPSAFVLVLDAVPIIAPWSTSGEN